MISDKPKKSIESLMEEHRTFPPTADTRARAWISSGEQYEAMWRRSIDEPEEFWLEQAESLAWFKKPTRACEYVWDSKARRVEHTWFRDALLHSVVAKAVEPGAFWRQ